MIEKILITAVVVLAAVFLVRRLLGRSSSGCGCPSGCACSGAPGKAPDCCPSARRLDQLPSRPAETEKRAGPDGPFFHTDK